MHDSLNTTNVANSSSQNVSDKHIGYFNMKNDHYQHLGSANVINSGSSNNTDFGYAVGSTNYDVIHGQNVKPIGSLHSSNTNLPVNYSKESQINPNSFQSNSQMQNQNVGQKVQFQTQSTQYQYGVHQKVYVNPGYNNNQQYLNPENISHNLPPKDLEELKLKAIQFQKQLPELPGTIVSQHYGNLEIHSKQININTFEVLKLCLYIVPGLPVFLLIFRSINDKEVTWHARQGLLMQVIWLFVYFVLQNLSLPLISGSGISLANIWNISCIGILVYAGSQAYIGKQYRIPVISDIGATFIDGK